MPLQHVASDGSFFGRWEAKKARALARRKEQAAELRLESFGGSRITQPPGGASSIVLGPETTDLDKTRLLAKSMDDRVARWTHDADRIRGALVDTRGGVSANVWANGASQNTGNFLSDRPTSRVLHPPGGRSSLTLG